MHTAFPELPRKTFLKEAGIILAVLLIAYLKISMPFLQTRLAHAWHSSRSPGLEFPSKACGCPFCSAFCSVVPGK